MRLLAKHLAFRLVVTVMGAATAVLLVVALLIGLVSIKRTEQIVADDLTRQQLIVARSLAHQVSDSLHHIRRELQTLAYSPSVQYLEDVAWANRMRIGMEELRQYGALEIRRTSADGSTSSLVTADGTARTEPGPGPASAMLAWARDPAVKGRFHHGPVEVERQAGALVPTFQVGTPVYQESVDPSHPHAPGAFGGVLTVRLRLDQLVGRHVAGARDEHSAYAWALADDGRFLYHPDEALVGLDASTARHQRSPGTRFDRIDEIQKTRMLRGEEGTSWYISDWHLGQTGGEVKKYVAFSPVTIEPGRFWSVAAVVPAAEVARTVRSTYVRQLFVQAVLVLALVFAGMALVWHERRWSREMEARVKRATSDLLATNASLRRAEEKYRSVVDSVREFIVVVDPDGRIQAINRFAATALGAEAPDLWGQPLSDLLRPADAQALLAHVHQALDRGRSLDAHLTIKARGRDYQLAGHFVPLPEEGPADRVLLVAHDIEEHQRLEEVLYRTEKLASLGRLAAGVGHEINNPIAVILGFTEVLLESAPEGSELRETLMRIERQGLACKRIVENLLAFARIPQKAGDRTDVNQDVGAILEILGHALKTRRIDLKLDLAEGLPRARADSGQLQQVFMNLTNNAMAAMPDGGALTVSTRLGPLSKLVEIAFSDSGCGIPREHTDKVFEPFFTTKKVGEGTGLGLSVSHAIVTKFGGTISFETRPAGDSGGPPGTTFLVSLLPAPEKPVP